LPLAASALLALVPAAGLPALAAGGAVARLRLVPAAAVALAGGVAELRVLRRVAVGLPSALDAEPRHLRVRSREERPECQEDDDEQPAEAEPTRGHRGRHLRLPLPQVAPHPEQARCDEQAEGAGDV